MPGEEKSGPWHGEEVGRNVSGGGGGQQAVDHVACGPMVGTLLFALHGQILSRGVT